MEKCDQFLKHAWLSTSYISKAVAVGNIKLLTFIFAYIFPLKYIEDNTWLRGDVKFIFECSTRYLTSERSERVRYRFEHEKINFISPSNHVLFCLFYKPTNNEVFDDFPKISDIFRRFHSRRLPRKIRRCFDLISINLGPLSIVTWQTL